MYYCVNLTQLHHILCSIGCTHVCTDNVSLFKQKPLFSLTIYGSAKIGNRFIVKIDYNCIFMVTQL